MSRTSAQIPDFVGHVVDNGRYEMLQVLGAGAYGVVYRALDLTTASSAGSPVERAIKILDKRDISSKASKRVRREAVLHHVVCEHPNVVTMHHAFEDETFVYLVLDYCPGGDLFARISDDKMFFRNDGLSKSVFLKILDAVAFCHQKRVFHRDLKPENILCSKDGSQVCVTDFGLCTAGLVSQTFSCGSGPYMSPECIGKEAGFIPYSNRTNDIWALGVILINMITSRSPWSKAITSDDCFVEYLLNENYLCEMLPISKEANVLFRKIFTYEPSERITLSALRKEIIALETFFMTDDEIARAGEIVQAAAAYCGVHVQPAEGVPPAKNQAVVDAISRAPSDSPAPLSDDLPAASSVSTESSRPSSSGTDSGLPITPDSYPENEEICIPELESQLAGLGFTGLIKEGKMPSAPRIVQFARSFLA